MKRPNRLLAIVGGVLVLLFVLLLVLPLLLKGPIEAKAKTAINEKLNARVNWSDLGLSFFRHFPNLTLTLDDLTTVGTGKFEADTLAAVRHLRVVVDLGSAIGAALSGKPIVIRAVELDQPRISLLALEDGSANWDITRPSAGAETSTGKAMDVSLRKFAISDGAFTFDNRQSKVLATVRGYNQSLSGDFGGDRASVQTSATADTVSVTFAGVPYLNRVRVGFNVDAAADLAKKVYALKNTELTLNDLRLGVAGTVATGGKNLGLDLQFNAPSTKFRDILSLVPVVYARDFDKVKTAGTMAVSGKVKGDYGDSIFPALALNVAVDSAAFQYPDLPLPARDIAVRLAVSNPGGTLDSTTVNLEKFHVRIGANPVDARMLLRTPISDPDVDASVSGRVDLADVSRTVKMEGFDQVSGILAADAAVRARLSAVKQKRYDRVAASGTIDVGNLVLKGKQLPKEVAIRQASLRLAPEAAELRSFDATIGSSDIKASGKLLNLLGFAMERDTLKGSATVESRRFNLTEWMSKDTSALSVIPVPPRIDFDLNATVGELLYDKLTMRDAKGRLRIKDQRVTLQDFRMNTLGGQIALTGYYETTDTTKPTFDVGFMMTKVDIPQAFKAFTTVQMLAPVAKYATGEVSTDLRLAGALGRNMLPLFPGLDGKGSFQTSRLLVKDFPAFAKVADVTKLAFFNNPTMDALKGAFAIREGRLFVNPFTVNLGPTAVTISGSNGLDQSLQYDLNLKVPRSLLGGGAGEAISGLLGKANQAGVNLGTAAEIPLGIKLGGTVTSPSVSVGAGSLASSASEGAKEAVKEAVTSKVDTAAARLVAEAEQRAAQLKQEAESLAAKVKREGYRSADSIEAKASNPILKAAAKPVADKVRKQSDKKAADIVSEANRRADSLVAAAKRKP